MLTEEYVGNSPYFESTPGVEVSMNAAACSALAHMFSEQSPPNCIGSPQAISSEEVTRRTLFVGVQLLRSIGYWLTAIAFAMQTKQLVHLVTTLSLVASSAETSALDSDAINAMDSIHHIVLACLSLPILTHPQLQSVAQLIRSIKCVCNNGIGICPLASVCTLCGIILRLLNDIHVAGT